MENEPLPEVPAIPEVAIAKQEEPVKKEDLVEALEYIKNLEFLSNPTRFNAVVYETMGIILQELKQIKELLKKDGKS